MSKPVLSPVELLTDLEGRLTLSRRADLSVNIARALLEQAEQKKSDIDDGIDTLLDRAAAAVDTTVLRQMAESRLDALLSNGFIKLEPLEDTVPVVEIATAPAPARRRRRRSQSQEEQSTETVPADDATPAAAAPVVEAPAVETPAAEAPVVEDKPSVVSAVSEVAPADIEILGPVSTKAEPLAGNVEDLAVDIDELPDLTDAANVEDTRQDAPVADAPVVEAPAAETPVIEAPVVEQVQAEAAPEKAEDAAPAAEPADKEEVVAPARPSLTLRRSFASRQSA